MVFPKIISSNQGAFVKGRFISDNILIVQEIPRCLRVGKSRSYHMTLKIDMNKAYDRVKWSRVIPIMQKVGFSSKW